MTIPVYLRALSLFYRSVMPFVVAFSLLIIGTSIPFGNWPLQLGGAVLFMKLITFPVIKYLSEQRRPHQYWLYLNLHIVPWHLWAGIVVLDTALFSGAIFLLHQVVLWL